MKVNQIAFKSAEQQNSLFSRFTENKPANQYVNGYPSVVYRSQPAAQQAMPMFSPQQMQSNSNSGDNVVKYAGIAALVVLPLVAYLAGKGKKIDFPNYSGDIKKLSTDIGGLKTKIDDITTKLGEVLAKAETLKNGQETLTKATKGIGAKVMYFFGILAAGATGAVATKALDQEHINSDDKLSITKAASNILGVLPKSIKDMHPLALDTEPVWGGLELKNLLNSNKKLSAKTISDIRTEIIRSLTGQNGPTEIKKNDAKLWSVSYETQFNTAGGQKDIAVETPLAFSRQGIDTYAIAPLFNNASFDSAAKEKTFVDNGNGTYSYKTAGHPEPVTLEKVYEGDLQNKTPSGEQIKFTVFKGDVDGQKYLFVTDNYYFDYRGVLLKNGAPQDGGTTYANLKHSHERARMAEFNNIVYETLAAAKEGKLKCADGTFIDPPNCLISHEAWMSGGLLAKMRLLSIAEEADPESNKQKDTAQYLRKLANNTAVPIHNLGIGYQGRLYIGDEKIIAECFNILFGGYSGDIVDNALMEGIKDAEGQDIFGTVNQRLGFTGGSYNPASMSIVLAGKIGTVSEGYLEEIIDKNLAGENLVPLLKLKRGTKDNNNGLVAFPNGVDKKPLAATYENVAEKTIKVNGKDEQICPMKNINDKLVSFIEKPKEPTKENKTDEDFNKEMEDYKAKMDAYNAEIKTRKIIPYVSEVNGSVDAKKFKEAKLHNKKMLIELIKDSVKSGVISPLFNSVFANNVEMPNCNYFKLKAGNFKDIDENTTIFSMISRPDAQKGYDTAVVAYGKLLDKLKKENNNNVPVLLMSGGLPGGKGDYQQRVEKLITEVQKKHPEARILWTQNRLGGSGLLFVNMTTTNLMPSDFEPYGISELKGLYAGSHVIVNEVGGMFPTGSISRKIYPAIVDEQGNLTDCKDNKKANALTVKDYEYMCVTDNFDKDFYEKYRTENESTKKDETIKSEIKDVIMNRNAEKLSAQMLIDTKLSEDAKTAMDINALNVDVSWEKGAIQNYLNQLKIVDK